MVLWINNASNVNRQNHYLNTTNMDKWQMDTLTNAKSVLRKTQKWGLYLECASSVIRSLWQLPLRSKEGEQKRVQESAFTKECVNYLTQSLPKKILTTPYINGSIKMVGRLTNANYVTLRMQNSTIGQTKVENTDKTWKTGGNYVLNVIMPMTILLQKFGKKGASCTAQTEGNLRI